VADGRAPFLRGDHATVLQLIRPAAEQGHAEAQNTLGFMYVTGRGVPRDEAAALAWYRKAAEQEHAAAQYDLARMYDRGQGVPRDLGQAYLWFRPAALRTTDSKVREAAEANLARVAATMTPAQIAEAQRQAAAWAPTLTP
jgi:TPR repeat protein